MAIYIKLLRDRVARCESGGDSPSGRHRPTLLECTTERANIAYPDLIRPEEVAQKSKQQLKDSKQDRKIRLSQVHLISLMSKESFSTPEELVAVSILVGGVGLLFMPCL